MKIPGVWVSLFWLLIQWAAESFDFSQVPWLHLAAAVAMVVWKAAAILLGGGKLSVQQRRAPLAQWFWG